LRKDKEQKEELKEGEEEVESSWGVTVVYKRRGIVENEAMKTRRPLDIRSSSGGFSRPEARRSGHPGKRLALSEPRGFYATRDLQHIYFATEINTRSMPTSSGLLRCHAL